jgi:hypothetical protein
VTTALTLSRSRLPVTWDSQFCNVQHSAAPDDVRQLHEEENRWNRRAKPGSGTRIINI